MSPCFHVHIAPATASCWTCITNAVLPACRSEEDSRGAHQRCLGCEVFENVRLSEKKAALSMPNTGLHSLLPLSPLPANGFESKPRDPVRQLQHLCASVLNRLQGRAHQQQSEHAPEHGGQLQSSAGSGPAVHGQANRLQGLAFPADAQPSHQSPPHDLRSGLHKVNELLLHVSCLMECTRILL